jgi:hypothetical protein
MPSSAWRTPLWIALFFILHLDEKYVAKVVGAPYQTFRDWRSGRVKKMPKRARQALERLLLRYAKELDNMTTQADRSFPDIRAFVELCDALSAYLIAVAKVSAARREAWRGDRCGTHLVRSRFDA